MFPFIPSDPCGHSDLELAMSDYDSFTKYSMILEYSISYIIDLYINLSENVLYVLFSIKSIELSRISNISGQ